MFMRFSVLSGAIAAMLFCSQSLAVVTLGDCKQQETKFEKGNVILQSKDGNCVSIVNFDNKYEGIAVVGQSNTLKNMFDDLGEEAKIPIPLAVGDQTLVDIANIMVDIFDKSADEKAQIIKERLPKMNDNQLLDIILAADYLDIGDRLLHIGLFRI